MRLIATDLDGTLLNTEGTIPAGNVEALQRAYEQGIHIVVATGRPVRWLDCLAPIAHLSPWVIASNGAVHYDLAGQRVVREHAFDQPTTLSLGHELRARFSDLTLGLERGDLFCLEPASPSDHANFPGVLKLPWPDLAREVTPVVKLLAYSNEHSTDELLAHTTRLVEGRACVTSSMLRDDFGMVELSVPGVTKASALAELCAQLGVEPSQVAAFGDMPNDADMLAWAGVGFVTAAAHRTLHARFTTIGPSGEGAVGQTIDRLLNN